MKDYLGKYINQHYKTGSSINEYSEMLFLKIFIGDFKSLIYKATVVHE